jgi:hypothetical protein
MTFIERRFALFRCRTSLAVKVRLRPQHTSLPRLSGLWGVNLTCVCDYTTTVVFDRLMRASTGMKSRIREVRGDVVAEAKRGACIAHCISGDAKFAAGIARTIDDVFGVSEQLVRECPPEMLAVGNVVEVRRQLPQTSDGGCCVARIFNIITKPKCADIPTYASLETGLARLRFAFDHYEALGVPVRELIIPRIGCGLDRLNWSIVSTRLAEIMDGCSTQITVCVLE